MCDVCRDSTGSMLVIGASDGSVSVMKNRCDESGQVDLTSFPAHSVALAGILFDFSV
jgi:hypothetical protein